MHCLPACTSIILDGVTNAREPNASEFNMMLPELADRQLQDYDRHRPGSIFADPALALTIAEAYALQFEVARLRMARGEPLAGYKIGCISPAMQAQFGLN